MVRAAVSTSLFVNLADGIQGTCLAAGVALNLRCFSVGLGEYPADTAKFRHFPYIQLPFPRLRFKREGGHGLADNHCDIS